MPAGAFVTPRVQESLKALRTYLQDAVKIAANIGTVDYTSREAARAARRAKKKKAKTDAPVKRRALPPKR